MTRLWLVIGMFLSLLVPVGFVACSVALPSDVPTQTPPAPSYQPTSTDSSTGSSVDVAAGAAARVVKTELKELRRLNAVTNWRASHTDRAKRAAAKLRNAARSLDSRPALRRVALRAAAFVLALRSYYANPTQAGYERYNARRKALNKAIGAAQ